MITIYGLSARRRRICFHECDIAYILLCALSAAYSRHICASSILLPLASYVVQPSFICVCVCGGLAGIQPPVIVLF